MIYKTAKRLYRIAKYPLSLLRRQMQKRATLAYVTQHLSNSRPVTVESFDFSKYKSEVLTFVKSLEADSSGIRYRYAASCAVPNLYSSAYVAMIYSLLGLFDDFSEEKKKAWAAYFDSFQRESDGLFVDESIRNQYFDDSDWWGARHLALHMITAYTSIGARPKYPFRFQEPYYDLNYFGQWLTENDSMFEGEMNNDFDNKLMNIYAALQYQRDFWSDKKAGATVKFLQDYLRKKINLSTGIWGDNNISDPAIRSRKVQFAYHLFPLFFYDKQYDFDIARIIDVTLATQNSFGGFAPASNSSACEDIDSIDVLVMLSKVTGKNPRIDNALRKGFSWVLYNQMKDGGFVFRLNEKLVYGDIQMSSEKNMGALFPTWFRTLSIAHLCEYFGLTHFKVTKSPGL